MELDSPAGAVAAEAAPAPHLSAFADRLHAIESAVAQSRERVKKQEEQLSALREDVDEFSSKFEVLRRRIESASQAVPAFEPPPAPSARHIPAAAAVPQPTPIQAEPEPRIETVLEILSESMAKAEPQPIQVPVAAAPTRPRRMRMAGLWPYALLAGCALALAPRISFQTGTPVSAEALVRVAPPPAPADRSKEAIALALAYRPEGSSRSFGQLLGPQLDTAGPSAWEAQSVGNSVYLVSFRPHDVMGPQADFEFTVDVETRLVTPEPDTAGRLYVGS